MSKVTRSRSRAEADSDTLEAAEEFIGDERKRWSDVGAAIENILGKCLTAERIIQDMRERHAPEDGAWISEMYEVLDGWIVGSIQREATAAGAIVAAVERARGWQACPDYASPTSPAEALSVALPPLLALERLVAGFDLPGGMELARDAIWQIERAQRLLNVEVEAGADGDESDAPLGFDGQGLQS